MFTFTSCVLALGLAQPPETPKKVMLDIRVISANEAAAERIQKLAGLKEDDSKAILKASARQAILRQADYTTIANPRITTAAGQRASVAVGETRTFVTGINLENVNGQTVGVPKETEVFVGSNFDCKPVLTKEGKEVNVSLSATFSSMNSLVPMTPVTYMIPPVKENGYGEAVPFTQFLEMPTVKTTSVKTSLAIPAGGSVLVKAGTQLVMTRNEFGPPVLSKVPYVNRLFKNVGIGRETQEIFLLVTATVVDGDSD